ncbi:uncharacterized protein PHLOEM PROTEIN 2-LIKE A4-like [Abrus precatorius]|uniref:Uncharacterized protein PHLOEM PROTEIN 2-LIKE A4-like n=1 Tax=Abrus precatorius TaxID=3816 RepID=A0A8B8KV85_ABRPR|nr:uncharacterized protein PHLOEM PROTEIN 2-LIKE A4-like [Abrus precatorius]
MGASQSELEPQSQSQPQQQQQPHPHEPTRRESWLLSPQRNAKPNETSSMMPVKPLKGLTLPHNCENILKGADFDDKSSIWGKLSDKLYAGVFLDNKTKKYWVEKKSNGNCFMLYARSLSITWAENHGYWKWVQQKEASGTMIEIAELKRVCWLEVHGKFDTRKLSPGILYQVSFVVMLKDWAEGWEIPINFRLVLPGGKKQQHNEILMEKFGGWIEIPVGEFVASENDGGEMEISMYEYEGGMWKTGLLIKGIAIKPKH